jgi:hypothetical protein
MNRYEETFARIASEVRVIDTTTFEHAELGKLRLSREMDTDSASPVLSHLWRFLYLTYYAGDAAAATVLIEGSRLVVALPDWEDPIFVDRLMAANDGLCYPNGGWTVVDLDQDTLMVRKNGLHLSVRRSELVTTHDLAVGSEAAVWFPCYLRFAQPRWFIALSESGACERAEGPITRLYLTPDSPKTAEVLLAAFTSTLNLLSVPFQIKLLNNPQAYERRDPFILYLHKHSWLRYEKMFRALHEQFAPRLRDDGPCFARELGRGWRIADEPVTGGRAMSFGQHRCLLIAEALLQAGKSGNDAEARYRAIVTRYRAEGLDVARPYANDGSRLLHEVAR